MLYCEQGICSVINPHHQSQHNPQSVAEMPSIDLGKSVSSLMNVIAKGMEEELDPYGLSPLEFNLLRTCIERGECTATELAEELPVDASRISRIVTILVDKGLLVRRRLRSDRRIVMLSLSDEGNEQIATLVDQMRAYEAQLLQNVSERDVRVFATTVSKILANHESLKSS